MSRLAASVMLLAAAAAAQEVLPREVRPGKTAGAPPSDAVVLFDGASLEQWVHADGRYPEWTAADGALICRTGSGDLVSRHKMRSAQIHLEFNIPDMPGLTGQAKGNSGVYLQGRYEIQVLDSYRNPTYPDGSAGALYGQSPPLVNPSLPPGEWQTYDIFFRAARCDGEGRVVDPPAVTVLYNGVLVQHGAAVKAAAAGACEAGPLLLQDHAHPEVKDTPLRFRNIWFRPLD